LYELKQGVPLDAPVPAAFEKQLDGALKKYEVKENDGHEIGSIVIRGV
jgi:hypothetical protein